MPRGVQAVTDTALAHLTAEDLVATLLSRIRSELRVDAATVLLLDVEGQDLVATASVGLEEEVAQGVRVPFGGGFAGKVAQQQRPMQIEQITPTSVLNEILLDRGVSSVLGVPMIATGHLLGVLHVASLQPRRFTEAEVNLLQVAAERLASATQAHLTDIDRTTTLALQRSLLPARRFELPGLQLAARYVPGAQEGVGGDWYDAFALPSGHTGIVIGDVVGHGLRAAVVMGRIRSALRAYALESNDPADVLSRLDRKISIFEPGAMATAIYVVIEPSLESMHLSVAGHPPPLMAEPDRAAEIVAVRPDLPLGADPRRARRRITLPFPPDALLLLYTDGLIERRGQTLDVQLDRLRAAVTAAPAETVCARVMSTLIGGEPAVDDVAVLATRRNPGP
jgi:serine phosphatase RsbU (regulator of sigma subunit)